MLTAFGKFCRKLRIDKGDLLKDMANSLGVSAAYLSAVEVGKRNVPEDWVSRIAEIYGLAENELSEMKEAYEQTITQIKIDLSGDSPNRRQTAMVFAREFKEFDDEGLAELLETMKNLKNKKKG